MVTAEEGDGLIRHMALNPLIASEIAAAAGKDHYDSAITPPTTPSTWLVSNRSGLTVLSSRSDSQVERQGSV